MNKLVFLLFFVLCVPFVVGDRLIGVASDSFVVNKDLNPVLDFYVNFTIDGYLSNPVVINCKVLDGVGERSVVLDKVDTGIYFFSYDFGELGDGVYDVVFVFDGVLRRVRVSVISGELRGGSVVDNRVLGVVLVVILALLFAVIGFFAGGKKRRGGRR